MVAYNFKYEDIMPLEAGELVLEKEKTTLINNLSNQVVEARIEGINSGEFELLLSEPPYYSYMRIKDLLIHYQRDPAFGNEYFEKLFPCLHLSLQDKLKNLSYGNRRKLFFLLTLSKKRLLYLLDEPFPYVNITYQALMKKMVLDREGDSTFLISTNQISEMESISDWFHIIKDFKIHSYNVYSFKDEKRTLIKNYYLEELKDFSSDYTILLRKPYY